MKYMYWIILTFLLVNLAACGSSSSSGSSDPDIHEPANDVVSVSFDEFVDDVRESTGSDAVNCGLVGVGEPEVTANTCVADAFVNDRAFYAAYELEGIDSAVGAAWSGDGSGEILRWDYDSNPAGGVPASSSKVDSVVCVDAEFSGSVDSGYADVFNCAAET